MSNLSTLNTAFLHRGMPLYWPSRLSSSFPRISKAFNIWNGIVASMRILLRLTPISYSLLLIGLKLKLNSLLTPSFYKIRSLISFPLSSGFSVQYAFLPHMMLTLGKLDKEARSWHYFFILVRFPFLSFLPFQSCFLYTVRSPCFT